jgi:predicted dehydrogenase
VGFGVLKPFLNALALHPRYFHFRKPRYLIAAMSNQEFKAVQVGCGSMGQGWMDAATKMPGIQMVGLVDMNRSAAEKTAERFKLPSTIVYNSLTEALAKTDADIVFDVTVPAAHEAVVIEALNAGRHVLGEKPMSESLASAQRMVAAAKKSGKTYAVTQNRRYNPHVRALRSFLASGKIGPVQEAHADFYIGAHFGGFRDEMAYPLILDMAIHTFDAARFFTASDPVSVYCHSFNPSRSWYKGDASAICIFEMTGGIVFSYRGSWCAEGQNTAWESTWRVLGSKGSVLWDGGAAFKAEADKPDAKPGFLIEQEALDVPVATLEATSHAGVMREFIAALREGRKPETDCQDNIKSLAMVLAAVDSARSGKKVPVTW